MPDNSSFAPNSFFFTDPAAITQSADQAFGPMSADEYRLTTVFDVAAGTRAYAICTSVVLVQPQTGDSDKVNLILRPYKQPILGLNIKYFIYRGLNRSDFFSGADVIPATATTSDFINNINASFAAYYSHIGEAAPEFLAKFIGFDEANQADTLPISDFFFKQSVYTGTGRDGSETPETAFDLPLIAAGASLGNFAGADSGIDIVLSYGDYSLPAPNDEFVFNLAYARAAEAVISVAAETDAFKKKVIKEQIFQFLDAAAYYGFHYRENGIVVVKSDGANVNKKDEAIYTDIVQQFHTKNRLYIYIQSDRTRSYNFYGNYVIDDTTTNCLKMGPDDGSLTAIDYATNGWPLLIDEAPQNTDETRNNLFLKFVTDNNPNAMLYGQVAQIDNAQGNNFCGPDDLKLPDNEDGTPSIFTKIINISNPAIGSEGAKLNVANFNILLFQGLVYDFVAGQTTDDDGNMMDVYSTPDFFDDVFDVLNATPLLKSGDSTYSSIVSQKMKLINHYYDNTQYGISAMQTSIINDEIDSGDEVSPALARVLYITKSIDLLNNALSVSGKLTPDNESSPSVAGAVETRKNYTLPDPLYFDTKTFTDSSDVINGIILKSTDSTTPSKIILGITKEENSTLIELINNNSFYNARLFLVDLFDGNELVSVENINYQKYNAGIIGETTTGALKLALCEPSLTIYSLDHNCHFSAGFSEHMNPSINNFQLTIQRDS